VDRSIITAKASLSGDKISSMRSILPTKTIISCHSDGLEKTTVGDQENKEKTKYDLARELITEIEEKIGIAHWQWSNLP